VSGEIIVPSIGPTDRLVELPAHRLVDAVSGAEPQLATALRIAARGDVLVVRFDARHRGVVATLRETNAPLWTEDVVEAFLAFEDPPRRYLELEANPLGAQFSARVDSPHGTRRDLSVETFSCAGFSARTRVRQDRWSATMRVPASALGRETLPESFRANFFRIDRTAGEFSALFPTRADPPDFHVAAAFGRFRVG
jgi:alpha-galactosidase